MRPMRILIVAVTATFLFGVMGCGGNSRYAKVSGVVTVNGQPYKNALVSFQPIGTADNPNPGKGSSAITDEQGRFTLKTDDGYVGAVVGKHRVRIQTKRNDPTAVIDPAVGSPDDPPAPGKKPEIDPIPLEWYSDQSTKEFDVPAGGTDKANFDIWTKKK